VEWSSPSSIFFAKAPILLFVSFSESVVLLLIGWPSPLCASEAAFPFPPLFPEGELIFPRERLRETLLSQAH